MSGTIEDVIDRSARDDDERAAPSHGFRAGYKQRILDEIAAAPDAVRTILAREGLYYADFLRWREQSARGCLSDSVPPSPPVSAEARENAEELERRLTRLRAAIRLTEATLAQARELIA